MKSWENGATGCAAALAAVLATPLAHAQDWSAALTVASDKVQRGISQNNGSTFWAADLNTSTDTGWNAALGWARPVYQAQGGTGELSVGGGKTWQLGSDWVLQLAAARYAYTGQQPARDHGYTELKAATGWQGRMFATLTLVPDALGYAGGSQRRGRAVAVELSAQQRLVGRLALDLGLGYNDLHALLGTSYTYGSVGLRWGVGPLQAQLSWIDSQAAQRRVVQAAAAGQRTVVSLIWAF